MSVREAPVAVGIDACRTGWFAVVLEGGTARGLHLESLDELAERVPGVDGIAVDIPLALPARGRRDADVLAKRLLGARHPVVFFTPPLAALEAPDHATASTINRDLTGNGLSQQSFALRAKILEARDWLPSAPAPVWEAHPEVSFVTLTGAPIPFPKRTWAGVRLRTSALASAGITVPDDDVEAAGIAVDDVLDAAVTAWTALRCIEGRAISIPEDPDQPDGVGAVPAMFA